MFSEISLETKELVKNSNDWGLVLYTDGGFRQNVNISGYGIHGYIYDYVNRGGGYGLKKCEPTNTGYVGASIRVIDSTGKPLRRSMRNHQPAKPVRIASYIDICQALEGGTNNSAETTGLLTALKLINEIEPPMVQLVLDSEYALKGALLWLKEWKKNNFVKSNGEEVSNKEIWLEIDDLMQAIEEKKIKISWDWVKGHSDDIGNNKADLLSNKAMNAGLNKKFDIHVETSIISKYWQPTADVSPMLKEPRLYVLINRDLARIPESLTKGAIYHFGNVGNEKRVEGQPSADRGYSVIHLPEPNQTIEMVKDYFKESCLTVKDLFLVRIRNDYINDGKLLRDFNRTGTMFLEPIPDKQMMKDVYNRGIKSGIGEAIYPVESSFKLATNLERLECLLDRFYLECNEDYKGEKLLSITEITNSLFVEETAKNKTVTKFITTKDSAIKVSLDIELDGKVKRRTVPLTFSIDVPEVNTLKRMAELNPEVYVIHWKEDKISFRYATVIKTDHGVGLWCAIYSNVIYFLE